MQGDCVFRTGRANRPNPVTWSLAIVLTERRNAMPAAAARQSRTPVSRRLLRQQTWLGRGGQITPSVRPHLALLGTTAVKKSPRYVLQEQHPASHYPSPPPPSFTLAPLPPPPTSFSVSPSPSLTYPRGGAKPWPLPSGAPSRHPRSPSLAKPHGETFSGVAALPHQGCVAPRCCPACGWTKLPAPVSSFSCRGLCVVWTRSRVRTSGRCTVRQV